MALCFITVNTAYAELGVECGVLPQAVCNQVVGDTSGAPVTSAEAALKPLAEWITNILIGLFGSLAVLVIIISGVQISASAGNEEVVKKGKENIFKVVTGLVLIISFRAILSLVDRAFVGVNVISVFDPNATINSPSGGLAANGIPLLISNVIGIAAMLSGVVAVIMIIVGAIQYIGSGGGDGITKAKKTITYALSGLVISILAYTIVIFIRDQLTK